jgi:hypothetical protein
MYEDIKVQSNKKLKDIFKAKNNGIFNLEDLVQLDKAGYDGAKTSREVNRSS